MNFLMFLSPLSWRKAFCLSIANDGLTMPAINGLLLSKKLEFMKMNHGITLLMAWTSKEATANLNKIFPKYSATKCGTKQGVKNSGLCNLHNLRHLLISRLMTPIMTSAHKDDERSSITGKSCEKKFLRLFR